MSPIYSVPIKTQISRKDTISIEKTIIDKIEGKQCNFIKVFLQLRNGLSFVSSE